MLIADTPLMGVMAARGEAAAAALGAGSPRAALGDDRSSHHAQQRPVRAASRRRSRAACEGVIARYRNPSQPPLGLRQEHGPGAARRDLHRFGDR